MTQLSLKKAATVSFKCLGFEFEIDLIGDANAADVYLHIKNYGVSNYVVGFIKNDFYPDAFCDGLRSLILWVEEIDEAMNEIEIRELCESCATDLINDCYIGPEILEAINYYNENE